MSSQTEKEEANVQFSTEVGYFDKYLEALNCFRDEGIIKFTEDYVFSQVADPSNVGMCISRIQGQALNGLTLENCDELELGMRFEKTRECLSGVSNTSEIEVTWPVTSGGNRLVRLDVVDEDLQFEISALDPSAVPDMPASDPLEHSTRIKINGSDLKKAIKHADKIGDTESSSVILETFDGVFQLRTSDKVDGNFKKQFHQSGPSEGSDLGEHETEIAMGYLDDINKVFGKGNELTVHIKQDNPVRFDLNLDDQGDAQVIYLIAPRLEG